MMIKGMLPEVPLLPRCKVEYTGTSMDGLIDSYQCVFCPCGCQINRAGEVVYLYEPFDIATCQSVTE